MRKNKFKEKRQTRTATFFCFSVCFTLFALLYKVILVPCIYGWRARHKTTKSNSNIIHKDHLTCHAPAHLCLLPPTPPAPPPQICHNTQNIVSEYHETNLEYNDIVLKTSF